jgi:hypothetical protein
MTWYFSFNYGTGRKMMKKKKKKRRRTVVKFGLRDEIGRL